jgi:hypothetical protein
MGNTNADTLCTSLGGLGDLSTTEGVDPMRILQQAGQHRPVLTFVVLSYAITWAGTLPFVLLWTFVTNGEIVPWMFVFLPLVYGPTIAAMIMTRVLEGRQAVRSLLQKYRIWNVGRNLMCST